MVKLIAELGINHNGSFSKLKKLIESAHEANVHAVKFQYRRDSEEFFTPDLEMGSTLIKDELKETFIKDSEYLKAFFYARKLGLKVGVSFFRKKDIKHLSKKFIFDFIKIPSAEALNFDLINEAKRNSRSIIISLGGTSWDDLKLLKKKITFRKNDCILYCVSNYPTALDAVHLSFIKLLKQTFKVSVGYSSHDQYWEVCIAAIAAGADIIERHLCLDKDQEGLDISSSSTKIEMKKLNYIAKNQHWNKALKISQKSVNQGEVQNIKDLGSGYYYKHNFKSGKVINSKDLIIKSPCRGIKAGDLTIRGKKLKNNVKGGGPVLKRDFIKEIRTSFNFDNVKSSVINYNLGLPIRFNDMDGIMNEFSMPFFEFHMSYEDVKNINYLNKEFWNKIKKSNAGYSIHLPDYISNKSLIDPLNKKNKSLSERSIKIIQLCVDFSLEIEEKTNKKCPIIGSFSVINDNKKATYNMLAELLDNLNLNEGGILPQFLPKRAWYFGGAVDLELFCNIGDVKYFSMFSNGICLDTAHLIMACNSAKGNVREWFKKISPYAKHIHLADAKGIDAEGVKLGKGEFEINYMNKFKNNNRMILEQWEGHLYNFKGFKDALNYLEKNL